jgi:hypothetical protein
MVYAIKMQTIYVQQKLCFHIKHALRVHERYSNVSNLQIYINTMNLCYLYTALIGFESFFGNWNCSRDQNECTTYYFSDTLNCACSFIRLLRLDHRSLKMFMTAQYTLFWEQESLINWSMMMMAVPCVNYVYSWISLKMFLVIYNEVH